MLSKVSWLPAVNAVPCIVLSTVDDLMTGPDITVAASGSGMPLHFALTGWALHLSRQETNIFEELDGRFQR